MSEIRFRLAKPCDAKQIASCHWHVRDRYSTGIFLSLGERFLRTYYKILLNDSYEVIVCAEREDGKIVGFNSMTIDAAAQARNLRAHKFQLGLAALKALILNPKLIKEVWMRYKSLSSDNDGPSFVHTEGARAEYWCWLKSERDSSRSTDLAVITKKILANLGIETMYSEIDKSNKKVFNYFTKYYKEHTIEIIDEIVLPDGRERVLLKETLDFDKRMIEKCLRNKEVEKTE